MEPGKQGVQPSRLAKHPRLALSVCPKCKAGFSAPVHECTNCGLIFAKYVRVQAEREAQCEQARLAEAEEAAALAQQQHESRTKALGGFGQRVAAPMLAAIKAKPVLDEGLNALRMERPLKFRAMKSHAQFFQRMGKLIQAGTPLGMAVERAGRVRGPIGPIADRTLEALHQGQNLLEAFESAGPLWPSYVWGHLEAGVATGRMDQMFQRLGDEIERRRKWILQQIFNWRMLYFFAMLFFSSLSLSITGSFSKLQSSTVEKGQAAVLESLIEGAVPRLIGYLFFFALLCGLFGYFQISGKQRLTRAFPAFERLRLKMPLFSKLVVRETMGRYLHLLGSLLEAGLPLFRALEIARTDIEFPEWRASFRQVGEKVARGASLSQGFDKVPHLPEDLIAELEVGERTGELGTCMLNYENSLQEEAQRLRLLVNLVFLVATILIGIVLTIYVAATGMNAVFGTLNRVISG